MSGDPDGPARSNPSRPWEPPVTSDRRVVVGRERRGRSVPRYAVTSAFVTCDSAGAPHRHVEDGRRRLDVRRTGTHPGFCRRATEGTPVAGSSGDVACHRSGRDGAVPGTHVVIANLESSHRARPRLPWLIVHVDCLPGLEFGCALEVLADGAELLAQAAIAKIDTKSCTGAADRRTNSARTLSSMAVGAIWSNSSTRSRLSRSTSIWWRT